MPQLPFMHMPCAPPQVVFVATQPVPVQQPPASQLVPQQGCIAPPHAVTAPALQTMPVATVAPEAKQLLLLQQPPLWQTLPVQQGEPGRPHTWQLVPVQ